MTETDVSEWVSKWVVTCSDTPANSGRPIESVLYYSTNIFGMMSQALLPGYTAFPSDEYLNKWSVKRWQVMVAIEK